MAAAGLAGQQTLLSAGALKQRQFPLCPARQQSCCIKRLQTSSPQREVVAAGILDGLFGSKGSSCSTCSGEGAIKCAGCKGTGRNRKNGNMFERWKCYDCQGFGLITCPKCGGGKGLTPEQRRER